MGYISIEEIYERIMSKDISSFFERLNNPDFIQKKVRKKGSHISLQKALYHIYKRKFNKAKIDCYNAGVNEYFLFNNFEILNIAYIPAEAKYLCLALLSDHKFLINRIAHIGKELDILQRNKGSLNLMLQSAMRDDEAALREAMATYEKYQLKKEWNELQLAFYKAYLERDEEKIKEVLTRLETPKLKMQDIFYREFIDDYLSVLTTAYLKLCWRKGMEIHIDSPTVPMEMMPIEPLEEYKIEYPYLEGWEQDSEPATQYKEEKRYEEVGPYPTSNPSLRSKFVHKDTVKKAVEHFCKRHIQEEKDKLADFVWESYTDPKHFDLNHQDYVRKYVSWPVTNADGEQVWQARPFWSELTVYNDAEFFEYCTSFIIMNEMSIEIDEVYAYLEKLKADIETKGGFFKRLFN